MPSSQDTSFNTTITFSVCGFVLGWALYQTQKKLCSKKAEHIPAVPGLDYSLEREQRSINLTK